MQQAVCVRRKKTKKKNAKKSTPPKTHYEIHSSPATACNSRRHAMKHVPRVSSYSPNSVDPGFVQIGLVQLSQAVKTTNVAHRQTHRRTNEIMAPCTHPGMNRLFYLKAKNGLDRFAPSALPHYEEAFLPKGKKRPRSLRSLDLASLLVQR